MAAFAAATLTLPRPLQARVRDPSPDPHAEDRRRLQAWVMALREAGFDSPGLPFGHAVARAGQQALGTPYEAFTLEAYLRDGGNPSGPEPLTLWLTRFDCVSLVESCIAIARLARRTGAIHWADFGREIEVLRYRGGVRRDYVSRLHYFSEWIRDNAERGALRDLGPELGAIADERPLRFMTENRDAYPALVHHQALADVAAMERRLDSRPRWLIPTDRVEEISPRLETGDVVAFATSIPGLDVTHAALVYRDNETVRVLHAPLSGGVVEITDGTLAGYVRALRRGTGILVARPLR
jgi:cell wall-associated NlpC family hydrolase